MVKCRLQQQAVSNRRDARQKQGSKHVSNSKAVEVLATTGPSPTLAAVWKTATAGAHATSGTNNSGDASNCKDAKKRRYTRNISKNIGNSC
jgi:hypothetical protein